MSDLGRKNFSDKAQEAATPENQKSGIDKVKETVTDKADEFAGKATPNDQKSFAQTIGDNVKQGHDDAKKEVLGSEDSLADTANAYLETAKEQLGNAANYVSGVVTGATEGAKKGADKE